MRALIISAALSVPVPLNSWLLMMSSVGCNSWTSREFAKRSLILARCPDSCGCSGKLNQAIEKESLFESEQLPRDSVESPKLHQLRRRVRWQASVHSGRAS